MSRRILLMGIVCLFHFPLISQSTFANELTVGSSLTYIKLEENELINHEWTWAINLNTPITKSLSFGLNYLNIKTIIEDNLSKKTLRKENYFVTGPFLQYDFLPNYNHRVFAEAGMYYGNYCTCGEITGFKQNGLVYYNWGLGLNWPLFKGLYLDTAFNSYYVINNAEDKFAYTQYVIGLDYHFGLKK